MRQVRAVVQAHGEYCVAGLQNGGVGGKVGLAAAVGLDVDVIIGVKDLFPLVAAEVFDLVDHMAAAVIALARIALGVFVGQAGAGRLHHVLADKVFRRDQLDGLRLALLFKTDQIKDFLNFAHCGSIPFQCRVLSADIYAVYQSGSHLR